MPRRLLITEDDPALLQMLSWEFEEMGYLVTAACCCREALQASTEQSFDLALLDFDLPDGVGIDLMDRLHRQTPGLPVVLYSGRATAAAAQDAIRRGACRFVCKPVTSQNLHEIFQRLSPCA